MLKKIYCLLFLAVCAISASAQSPVDAIKKMNPEMAAKVLDQGAIAIANACPRTIDVGIVLDEVTTDLENLTLSYTLDSAMHNLQDLEAEGTDELLKQTFGDDANTTFFKALTKKAGLGLKVKLVGSPSEEVVEILTTNAEL